MINEVNNSNENLAAIERVYLNSFWVYLGLAVFLIGIGFFGYGTVVITSGFYFAINMVLSALMYVGVRINAYTPTKTYPYGIGKLHFIFVTFGAVLISFAAVVNIFVYFQAIRFGLYTAIHAIALFTLVITVLANERLYHYIRAKGRILENKDLLRHAREARISSVISVLSILLVVLQMLGWNSVDYYGSIIILLMIFVICIKTLKISIEGLMDSSTIKVETIKGMIDRVPGVLDTGWIKTRSIGCERYELDLEVIVNPLLTIGETLAIEKDIKRVIFMRMPNVRTIMVNFA